MIGAYRRIIIATLIVLLEVSSFSAQDCKLPILSSFGQHTTHSVELIWVDFNHGQSAWDIEYGEAGFSPSGIPTISGITQKSRLIENLTGGTTYEFYLRTNCDNGITSEWNGPYFTNTAIDNDSSCGLRFELSDNNCPRQDVFRIEIAGYSSKQLGVDLVLENVDVIVEHPWPRDLRIKLISPEGLEISLTTNNGKGEDDYGDASIDGCAFPVRFTDNACQVIDKVEPPFIGQYRPEEALSNLYSMNSPNGVWQLNICDHANGDLGFLKYVKLNFSEMACIVPPSFSLADIEADNVTFDWQNDFACQALELVYKKSAAPISNSFSEYVVCGTETFTILDLEPDTEYELLVRADCGASVFSPESCLISFRTACQNSNISENFDDQDNCTLSCNSPCVINSLWKNREDNLSNWLLAKGPTPTSFTGPEGDLSSVGTYIYIENQDNICGDPIDIYLESTCLTKPDQSDCALSFSYHMFGQDIGSLSVEYSLDGENWNVVWQLEGSQQDSWIAETIDLPISFERGKIRFRAFKLPNALRGDIALDNIKLINIDTIAPLLVYEDNDNDGFGDLSKPKLICGDLISNGYVLNSSDCDDSSPTVYPGAPELKCNQIDDNCNGLLDDVDPSQMGYILGNVTSESCKGTADGLVTIQGVNGQEPYTYTWSNGSSGQGITDLTTGIYYCTITDLGGCQIVSDPIFIGFTDILVYSVRSMTNPSCFGENDGELEILIEGGLPPYTVNWNNGRRGNIISALEDGQYFATISDATSCVIITDTMNLLGPQILTTGIQQLNTSNCHGDSTGYISLGILGGVPPHDILWNNGKSEPTINNLPAEFYSVTVTDQNGCYNGLENIEISEPDPLEIILVSIEHISCPGESNSLIDINVKGGTPPFSYFWSDGNRIQDLINRPAGIYSVMVADFNGCTTDLNDIEILQPEQLEIEVIQLSNVKCIGSQSGYIEVSVTGGTGPYLYNWGIRDGDETDENFLNNLTFGNYSLTVVDAFNCKSPAITIPIVNNSIPLDVNLEVISEIDCYGDSTGIILAQVGTALAPLDYNWSSGQNVQTADSRDTIIRLISGSYNLTITDEEGCVGIADSVFIKQPSEVKFTLDSLIDNVCWYDSEGYIEIGIEGGQAPYEVSWSDGSIGHILSNLPSGSYSGIIADSKLCKSEVKDLKIDSEAPIELELTIEHPTESSLGSIEVAVAGGLGPYDYRWGSPLQNVTSSNVDNLEVGFYALSVLDENDCIKDTTIELKLSTTIKELERPKSFRVYPNPTTGLLNIRLDSEIREGGQLVIMNSQGALIYKQKILNYEVMRPIDLSEMPRGIYLIQVELGSMKFSTKIALID